MACNHVFGRARSNRESSALVGTAVLHEARHGRLLDLHHGSRMMCFHQILQRSHSGRRRYEPAERLGFEVQEGSHAVHLRLEFTLEGAVARRRVDVAKLGLERTVLH